MVNLKLYRLAWAIAVVLAAFSLLALRPPEVLDLSRQPGSFDGVRAMATVHTLARDHPGRVAGSPQDDRTAAWLATRIEEIGLKPQTDSFTATIGGREVVLRNVWAVSPGTAPSAIVVLANRDSPPLSTQGADNNASGIAAVLELARIFRATPHTHSIIYLWTDGDSYGGLGARDFVSRHPEVPILAVVALRQIADSDAKAVTFNGWCPRPLAAPPWLWILARSAALSETNLKAPLPTVVGQLLRLSMPAGAGSQAPFVAAGVPAISISAPGGWRQPAADTVDNVSTSTLGKVGRLTERVVATLDESPDPPSRSGDQLFFSKYRRLDGAAVKYALAMLVTPLIVVTAALWVTAVRRRALPRVTWARLGLRIAPWLLTLALVYLANWLSLLPRSPGAVIPPESNLAHSPRYLRVVLIVTVLVVVYHYAMTFERRLARRSPAGPEAAILVSFTAVVLIAVLTMVVNPFSLVLLVPVAVIWPLARPGPWHVSRLLVWTGLALVGVALVHFALQYHLGWHTWWYFFLLLENRTIPFAPIALGIALVTATALLGHDLHHSAAAAPSTGVARRRRSRAQ